MPKTEVRGGQVKDGSIQRADLDIATAGQAVIRRLVQGTGISLSSTGADSGTGDVTVSSTTSGAFDPNSDNQFTANQSFKTTDTGTGTINVITISHNTTGIPVVNSFGTNLLFQGSSDTTDDRSMGQISTVWSNIADATRSAWLDLKTALNGTLGVALRLFADNGVRINSSSTVSPGAGFYDTPSGGGYKINNVSIFVSPIFANNVSAGRNTVTLSNTNATNSGSAIIFDKSGTQRWQLGNDSTTNNAQDFYIYDSVAGAYRMLINSAGVASFPAGLLGTNTNDSAGSGEIGETKVSALTSLSATALSNNTAKNVTTIALSAGDWDVRGIVNFNIASLSAGTIASQLANIGLTSATVTDDGMQGYGNTTAAGGAALNGLVSVSLPPRRISVAGTTTIYLIARASFLSGTQTAFGFIEARRVR